MSLGCTPTRRGATPSNPEQPRATPSTPDRGSDEGCFLYQCDKKVLGFLGRKKNKKTGQQRIKYEFTCSLQGTIIASSAASLLSLFSRATLLVACPRMKNQLPIINMDVIIVGGQGVWAWLKVFKISLDLSKGTRNKTLPKVHVCLSQRIVWLGTSKQSSHKSKLLFFEKLF